MPSLRYSAFATENEQNVEIGMKWRKSGYFEGYDKRICRMIQGGVTKQREANSN